MRKQEKYWGYRAPDTPEFKDLPDGMFSGSEQGWETLSPGYRREIYRSYLKRKESFDAPAQ